MVEHSLIALLNNASTKASSGDLLGALDDYSKATEIDPRSSSAWYGLGVIQAKRGDLNLAITAFETAHDIEPGHGPTMANLAVLLDETDSTRASQLARIAMESVGEVPELLRISSQNPDEEEVDISLKEAPLLKAKPIHEGPMEETEEVPLLSASPVLSPIGDVISEVEELLISNSANEALELIQPRLEGDHSDNALLWSLCGHCLAQLGHEDDAIHSFEYSIRLGHDEAKTHYNLSQLLRKTGRMDDAKQSLANALLCDPGHVNSLFARGNMFAEEGDGEAAIQHWRRVIEIEPDHLVSERLSELEQSFQDEDEQYGDNEESTRDEEVEISDNEDDSVTEDIEEELDQAEIDITDTKGYRIAMARELTESGDSIGAVNAWKEVLEEDKQSPEVWNGLADALSVAGHIERAHQCRQRAEFLLSQETQKMEETEQVAEIDLIQAAAEAQERMSELPAHDEESVNVCIEWYNKGLALLTEDNGIEALNCFEKAIGGAPREEKELRIRSQNGRGHALYQLGRYAESIQAYHAAIAMDPAGVNGRTLYNMGSSYANVEHYSDAIKCFEQAMQRGLSGEDKDLCRTQINRCRLLSKEQMKRRSQAV
ncbi:MAG: tetratricopeptide repeat protein [Candidatus Thermoplasmatota archaeon]|nr:tetratricopeptide repeat protein [Candidatus Thermoplasmatota archaeon]